MKLAIGCDEAGLELKNALVKFLQEQTSVPVEITDFGVNSPDPVDYPDIAVAVAEAVSNHQADRAILICGTGIGMSITANKVPGVRAAQASHISSLPSRPSSRCENQAAVGVASNDRKRSHSR